MVLRTAQVVIDSNYRDESVYPSPSAYVHKLMNVIGGVVSVELMCAIFDRTSRDKYVNLKIDELSGNSTEVLSNSNVITRSFAQLLMHPGGPVCSFERHKSGLRHVKRFDPPLAKLSRLSIEWIDPKGQPYGVREHLLVFQVIHSTAVLHPPSIPQEPRLSPTAQRMVAVLSKLRITDPEKYDKLKASMSRS